LRRLTDRILATTRGTGRLPWSRSLVGAVLVAAWGAMVLLAGLSVLSFLIGIAGGVVGWLVGGLAAAGAASGPWTSPRAGLRREPGDGQFNPSPMDRPDWEPAPSLMEPVTPGGDPVPPVLDSLRTLLGAHRLVLWRVDPAAGVVAPMDSTGAMPTPRPAAGEPIHWCADEYQPLRIEPMPGWADTPVLAVPVRTLAGVAVLTVEAPVAEPGGSPRGAAVGNATGWPPVGDAWTGWQPAGDPTPGWQPVGDAARNGALLAAGILGLVLDLRQSDRQRLADLDHVHRILAFLRDPPRAGDPSAFPHALARTAAEAAGSAGALVASWDPGDDATGVRGEYAAGRSEAGRSDEEATGGTGHAGGVVLARYGRGRGPEPGMEIAPGDSDLAIAVRAGTTLHRDGRDGTPPLASVRERWSGRPRFTTIIPLLDPSSQCGGLLALWGDQPVEAGVVALLEALGPVLILQLGHSLDLVRIRDRVDRDGLTGLPNRAAFDERLEVEARRFHRYRRPLALLVLDLDHFKAVNDSYGHPTGDAVLQRVADLLRANTRDPDVLARYGGEEMVVILPETMLRPAIEVAERIRAAVEATRFDHEGRSIDLTVSIGVSACPECVDDPADLLRAADDALYQAKREGRNRVATAPLVAAGA
jgi:diguanylate cyclase (GGDEF)-like protein